MSAAAPRFPPRRPLGRTGFVATRLGAGDLADHLREPVAPQVAGSLSRLGLPNVDLLVFHACSTLADWAAIAERGAGSTSCARRSGGDGPASLASPPTTPTS